MAESNMIREIVKKTFLYKLLVYYRKLKTKRRDVLAKKTILTDWNKDGRPVPPPHIYKIGVIQQYAARSKSSVLIETGTYLGETIDACKHLFKTLISIELDDKLYESARAKFANASNITIYKGDSGVLLENILENVTDPCIFWLDGHYSEGFTAKGLLNTPIISELSHIFNRKIRNSVILIDDARCFTGENDYPTISFLKEYVSKHDGSLNFVVEDDIIRICYPPQKMRGLLSGITRKFISLYKRITGSAVKQRQQSVQAMRVAPWFRDNGDHTHRLNYNLNENATVFDLGGYEGQWASDIFSKYGCSVYVFEPFLPYAAKIATRFSGNTSIRVFDYGLAGINGDAKLAVNNDASSIFKPGDETVDIKLVKVDDFLAAQGISYVDLVKINIEGGEYDILEYLIEKGLIAKFANIQVQFHDFVPDAENRMKEIQKKLQLTHRLTYQYIFVWENWELLK